MARTIRYDYVNDGYFAEIKESEMLKNRMQIFAEMKNNEMVGTFFSQDFVMRHILKMSDGEMLEQQEKIAAEAKAAEQQQEDEPEQQDQEGDNDDGQE